MIQSAVSSAFSLLSAVRGMTWSAWFGWLVMAGIVFVAVFAPWICGHPHDLSSGPALTAPGKNHLLGTDELGGDLWAQICFGARVSLAVGLGTAFLSGTLGALAGMLSGYLGGFVDKIVMRIVDVIIVLPDLPVMILLAAFLGPSLVNIIVVLSLFSWVLVARVVRSRVLSLKGRHYITSAEMHGAAPWYIICKHLLPEVFPLAAVSMIRLAGRAVVAEAGLSFLGLGDPASKSWGLIIHHATSFEGIYYTRYWQWWLVYPWAALTLLVTALAFISRDLESRIEAKPNLRNRLK